MCFVYYPQANDPQSYHRLEGIMTATKVQGPVVQSIVSLTSS